MLARRRRIGAVAAVIAAGALAWLAISLLRGGDESNFTAQEFVRAANSNGARISLGGRLFAESEDKELWAVRLSGTSGADAEGGAGTGGSLAVFGGEEEAERDVDRCRATGSLLCIRAENVVLALEEEARGTGLRRLIAALARLGAGDRAPSARSG